MPALQCCKAVKDWPEDEAMKLKSLFIDVIFSTAALALT